MGPHPRDVKKKGNNDLNYKYLKDNKYEYAKFASSRLVLTD
jgi:hypothetical protein